MVVENTELEDMAVEVVEVVVEVVAGDTGMEVVVRTRTHPGSRDPRGHLPGL